MSAVKANSRQGVLIVKLGVTPKCCSHRVFYFAVLKPLVEMTTIHYKPFENSPHKCHPLSAVSTPRTQGIFKKPNLQLSEILLNSYLFAAGSFCAIPLLCIGAEINHQPCTAHQDAISIRGCAEDSHNTIDNQINKRGGYEKYMAEAGR